MILGNDGTLVKSDASHRMLIGKANNMRIQTSSPLGYGSGEKLNTLPWNPVLWLGGGRGEDMVVGPHNYVCIGMIFRLTHNHLTKSGSEFHDLSKASSCYSY